MSDIPKRVVKMHKIIGCIIAFMGISSGYFNGTVLICGDQMWRSGALQLVALPSMNRIILDYDPCYGAIFSPQGDRIAYIKNNKIYIINNDGSNGIELKTMVPTGDGGSFLTWIKKDSSDYVYFSIPASDSNIYRTRVDISDSVETVFKSQLGTVFGLRVSRDGNRAGWTKYNAAWINQVIGVDFPTGQEVAFGAYPDNPGCQGCISPSGEYITHNLNTHLTTNIHPFVSPLTVHSTVNDTLNFSLTRYSSSNDSFITYSAMDGSKGCFVYNTTTGIKDSVGSGEAFDVWPGPLPMPPDSKASMKLTKDAIRFIKNDSNQITPSSIQINCENIFPTAPFYGVTIQNCPLWLIISVDSTDRNNLIITDSINNAIPLMQGTYCARIMLESPAAFPSRTSFKVTYTVGGENAPVKIEISAPVKEIKYGDTMVVLSTVLNQNGDTLVNYPVLWKISGAESIDSVGRYICESTALGPIYIVGSAGNFSDTDTVMVTYVKSGYTFIKPDKNDTVSIGDSLLIEWESREDIIDAVFEISPNDGKTWYVITGNGSIKRQSSDWGRLLWLIPKNLKGDSLEGKQLMIKIREYSGPEYSICSYKITVNSSNNSVREIDRRINKTQHGKFIIINSHRYAVQFYDTVFLCFFNLKGVCIKKLDAANIAQGFSLARGLYTLKTENTKMNDCNKIFIQ